MKSAQLKIYKISKLDFKNNVKGMVQLNFQSKVSHNVKYSKNNTCEAVLSLEIVDPKNPNSISVSLELSGVYSIRPEASKEEIHIETCKELFTYAKTFVTTITAVAGIKPITINDIDFDNQEIFRYNINDIKRQLSNPSDDTVDGPDGSDL